MPFLHTPLRGVWDLAVRVAGRPGVVAEGAVRPAGHLVEQRQVARGRRLVHDYGIDSSGNVVFQRGFCGRQ